MKTLRDKNIRTMRMNTATIMAFVTVLSMPLSLCWGTGWEAVPEVDAAQFKESIAAISRDSVLLELNVDEYRDEGVLRGCGVSFVGIMRDWAYRNNQPVRVGGSISYHQWENRAPAIIFRIGLVDFRIDDQVTARESEVHYAYLRTPRYSLAGKEMGVLGPEEGTDSPKTNYRSFVYLAEPEVFGHVFGSTPLIVAFNREKGQVDLEFELRLISQPNYSEFIDCIGALLEWVEY